MAEATPYGLDKLLQQGWQPRFVATELKPTARLANRMLEKTLGGFQWLGASQLLESPPADAVLTWDERQGVPAASRQASRPPLVSGCIWLTEASLASPAVLVARRALRRAGAVFVLSTAQLPLLQTRLAVPVSRSHYVPFGVSTSFWASVGPKTDRGGKVVSAGNDRHRDYRLLLEAARESPQIRAAGVLIITSRNLGRLPSYVEQRSGLNHVEMRSVYSQASVVVVPTSDNAHVSGITVALEAAAAGKPVVVARTPGMTDYLSDHMANVYRPGDVSSLRSAIDSFLSDSGMRMELSSRAQEHVLANNDTRHQAQHLAKVLDAAL